tara:strand:+ start:511 stop:1059 length:549 start_codon:yes stop_codon:yes gene_type:complete
MGNFNAHKWFKNQYLKESDDPKIGAELEAGMFGTGVAEGQGDLYSAFSSALPENTSYKDFAKAVAKILIDDYGSHNFNPFMEVLHAELGINESLNENEDNTLAREIESRFGGDPYVDMRDGKNGTITFRERSEFPDSEWGEILDFLKSKGFEITSESNYYDIEPGEREWFPKINITSNTTSI